MPKLPVDLLDDVSAITVEVVGVTNDVTSKITTSTAQNRLERLCKKVEQDRFILRVDVANFFQVPYSLLLITKQSRIREAQKLRLFPHSFASLPVDA